MNYPTTLPEKHKQLLVKILNAFASDKRICGVGISGSYIYNNMDEYSDLDLVIAIDDQHYESFFSDRFPIIESIEGNIASFSGEHVGEPRLIISLFEPHTIHVDFKIVSISDAPIRVDEVAVLWERNKELSNALKSKKPHYPIPDPQWMEDRFWIWVHYGATKIARGEYFEALEFISFLRQNVLSPLALTQNNQTPSGVRRIEQRLPDFSKKLVDTVSNVQHDSLVNALNETISLYLDLRDNEDVVINHKAQLRCTEFFNSIIKKEIEPQEVLKEWVDAFNEKDAERLSLMYAENAVNHQMPTEKIVGRDAIQKRFAIEFQDADMVCVVEHIHCDGDWAILEWKDPKGFKGCGFFQIKNGLIQYQRGYWDRLSFLKANDKPLP